MNVNSSHLKLFSIHPSSHPFLQFRYSFIGSGIIQQKKNTKTLDFYPSTSSTLGCVCVCVSWLDSIYIIVLSACSLYSIYFCVVFCIGCDCRGTAAFFCCRSHFTQFARRLLYRRLSIYIHVYHTHDLYSNWLLSACFAAVFVCRRFGFYGTQKRRMSQTNTSFVHQLVFGERIQQQQRRQQQHQRRDTCDSYRDYAHAKI